MKPLGLARRSTVAARSTERAEAPFTPRPASSEHPDRSSPAAVAALVAQARLPVQEPRFSGATSPFPVVNRARDLLERHGERLTAMGVDTSTVVHSIFALLTRGDPEGAQEKYRELERLAEGTSAGR